MKFNEETMTKKTDEMLSGSELWRGIYENAPELAKERLRVAFWASQGGLDEKEDIDEYRKYRERLEAKMSYDDFAYLAENFPKSVKAGRVHYAKMRDEAQFRSLKTPEKLDEAIAVMTEGASDFDRETIRRTRELLEACDHPLVKPTLVWEAVGGNGRSACLLGDLFDHGHGVEVDEDLAFYWFRRGALSGDGESCYRLAHLCEDEEGRRFDSRLALFWFREGLRRNDRTVKSELGHRLTLGRGWWEKFRNPEVGVALLMSSLGDDDYGNANYYLGRCYEEGVGVPKSRRKALTYYRIAEDHDHWGAKDAIARLMAEF